jgi:hypothetical protein
VRHVGVHQRGHVLEVHLDGQRILADQQTPHRFDAGARHWAGGAASPWPVRPPSVSIRIRQFPAMFWIAMARISVIFTRFRFGAASAR